ncbi:MAG: glycerol-3-phosphate 1-O-acyltransferase PlsY [Epsilonproteobacteria bacterium]|nr:glycerol-3-phosphate 1-O-acyltransferase PlsY [Campylobacterota bacterium]
MEFLANTNVQLYIAAYLIGSIPFGLLLAKFIGKVDIRQEGSGNIGATNVLRVLKQKDPKLAKKLGGATLALDAFKGIFALLIGYLVGVSEATMWAIAVFAVIGHCFSIFLMGEGGKGVATGFGVLVAMLPICGLIGIAVWLISAKVFKVVSLASLIGILAAVAASFVLHPDMKHAPVVIIGLIIFYKHSENIYRLIVGQESKIAQ